MQRWELAPSGFTTQFVPFQTPSSSYADADCINVRLQVNTISTALLAHLLVQKLMKTSHLPRPATSCIDIKPHLTFVGSFTHAEIEDLPNRSKWNEEGILKAMSAPEIYSLKRYSATKGMCPDPISPRRFFLR